MTLQNATIADSPPPLRVLPSVTLDNSRAHAGPVSWSAVTAGAAAAASLSLILLMLGTGLGLSSVSPWAQAGASASAFGVATIVWVTCTQIAAAGMGGYLAGRLRTKWIAVHTDEVYFRDTVHGFLAWAVASLATAALLTSVIGSIVGGGVQAGAVAATASAAAGRSGAAGLDDDRGPMAYFIDALFRQDRVAMAAATAPPGAVGPVAGSTAEQDMAVPRAEVARIFMNGARTRTLPADDVRHVGQLITQHTGLTRQDAEKRVMDTYSRVATRLQDLETAATVAADKARKAAAHGALWLFISLLVGAFVASLAATYGGRHRDT